MRWRVAGVSGQWRLTTSAVWSSSSSSSSWLSGRSCGETQTSPASPSSSSPGSGIRRVTTILGADTLEIAPPLARPDHQQCDLAELVALLDERRQRECGLDAVLAD